MISIHFSVLLLPGALFRVPLPVIVGDTDSRAPSLCIIPKCSKNVRHDARIGGRMERNRKRDGWREGGSMQKSRDVETEVSW